MSKPLHCYEREVYGHPCEALSAAATEIERLREALEAITHWWKGDAPLDGAGTSYRPDIVARAALDGVTPAEAHQGLTEGRSS